MFNIIYRALAGTLFAILLPCAALAQEDKDFSLDFPQNKELLAEQEKDASLPQPATTDTQELCVYYHKRGIANARLGRYDQSIADLKQALSLNQPSRLTQNQWCERWRMQNDLSSVLDASGDLFTRIEFLNALGAEVRKIKPHQYFHVQIMLTGTYMSLGMIKQADETFRSAVEVLPEVKRHKSWTKAQYGVMGNYNEKAAQLQALHGNHVEAERLFRAALSNAAAHLETALSMEGKDSQWTRGAQGRVANNTRLLAANLSAQGKLGEAEFLAREALRITLSYSTFNTTSTSNALATLAEIKLQLGKLAEAARLTELSIQALEQSNAQAYSTRLASRRAQMGLILGMQGRWNDALSVFETRDQGLRSNPDQFAKSGSRNIDWAMTLLKTGQGSRASEMLQKSLHFNLGKPFVDPVQIATLRGYLGAALAEQGKVGEALRQFNESLPTLLKQAYDSDNDDDSGFVGVYRLRLILEAYLELLAGLHSRGQQVAGLDVVAEAFKLADIARHSSVQRAVTASAARATLPNAQLAQLARREQDATNQMQALNKLLIRLASAPEGQRLRKVMDDMQRDIKRLAAEQVVLRKEIAEKFPDYASLVDPKPASPADIQKALQPDEALISIYSGERQAYVWTITKSAAVLRSVPLSREQIAADVAKILKATDLSGAKIYDFDTATAYHLYDSLLAPDQAKWATAKLINVVPHGALGSLPFAMLLTGPAKPAKAKAKLAYAELPWLIAKLAIAQQSSVSGFMALRRQNRAGLERKPFIGFGDPIFSADATTAAQRGTRFRNLKVAQIKDETLAMVEQAQQAQQPAGGPEQTNKPTLAQAFSFLPALPDTAEELKEIALVTGADRETDLFLGSRATEANVKAADLSSYRVLAFATHGLRPGEIGGLDQPALAMSNPALAKDTGNDGFLTMEEVLGLKLNADWVVLSACNTASADGNASEAVSGLGRAFFYAGTRSLLVTNWSVETVSARLLTTGLFRQQASRPDIPRAEALRQSMLALMKYTAEDYSHPVFWAPFSLIGDGLVQ